MVGLRYLRTERDKSGLTGVKLVGLEVSGEE